MALLEGVSAHRGAGARAVRTARPHPICLTWKAIPNSTRLAIWRRSSIAASTPNGSRSARAKIRATSRSRLPRTLARLPYGEDTKPIDEFKYEEQVDGTDHSKYLWMNAAYALGTKMTQSYSLYGMCVAMRGVEGGGLVEGLPTHNFATDEGDVA